MRVEVNKHAHWPRTYNGEPKVADAQKENLNLRVQDRYAWTRETEKLLSEHCLQRIDWDAVAVELERSAEINDAIPMREAVEMLLTHLAIWNISTRYHNPNRHFQIASAKYKLEKLLARSPSLTELIDTDWRDLRARARFDAMLILRESPLGRELPTLAELIVAETAAEAEAVSATRLSLHSVLGLTRNDYDSSEDHYAWCREQATAARARRFSDLDPLAIAEEISNVAASIRSAAVESLAKLIDHLITWQVGLRSQILRRWIDSDRAAVRALLWTNRSLAAGGELVTEACKCAGRERTWKPAVGSPQPCPWTLSQVLDDAFMLE
jgi:hypothetical protein